MDLSKDVDYQVYKIEGLGPADADVFTDKNIGYHGSRYKSSRINARNINIYIALEGAQIEKKRLQLFQYVKPSYPVTISFQNDSLDVWIKGYVETVAVNYFDTPETIQITALCPDPFWHDAAVSSVLSSRLVPDFQFPFSNEDGKRFTFGHYDATGETVVENTGDVACGLKILCDFTEDSRRITVYNRITRESIAVQYPFKKGDLLTIDTSFGHKSVDLLSNAVHKNLFNSLLPNSDWLQLDYGTNVFTFETYNSKGQIAAGAELHFVYQSQYEGV